MDLPYVFSATNSDDQDNSRRVWSRRAVRPNASTCKCQWRLKIAVDSRTKNRLPPDILERLMVQDPRIWGYEGHKDPRLRIPDRTSGLKAGVGVEIIETIGIKIGLKIYLFIIWKLLYESRERLVYVYHRENKFLIVPWRLICDISITHSCG